ncbi:MAG: aminotransferase class III-fold pyridoxal phosphate-dependent enzyme, partial [Microthrixaceae bacterium]
IDEVQTGLGRCGSWFAFQQMDVQPDVVTMAKALGNGVPIGACWAQAQIAGAFQPGDHATTFGGQPLSTSAARAVLQVMQQEDVPTRAQLAGAQIVQQLQELDQVVQVRGLGLLLAVELDCALLGDAPATRAAAQLLNQGVVVNAVTPTAIRLAPSLLISEEEINQAALAIGSVLFELQAEQSERAAS